MKPPEIPWRRWQEIAFGVLGWKPQEYWQSTLTEFFAAYDGWAEANGVKKAKGSKLTKEEQAEVRRKYGAPTKSIRGSNAKN